MPEPVAVVAQQGVLDCLERPLRLLAGYSRRLQRHVQYSCSYIFKALLDKSSLILAIIITRRIGVVVINGSFVHILSFMELVSAGVSSDGKRIAEHEFLKS